MKNARLLLLVVLLTGSSRAWQQPKAERAVSGNYEISGRVVNTVTSEPLPGVTVTLSLSQNGLRPRTLNRGDNPSRSAEINPVITDKDGGFLFPGVKPGKYSLGGSKRGFVQQLYEQHEGFSTAIVVGPDKESSNIIFRLKPDASVVGRIIDEHNEPVANAQVSLFREGIQNGRHGIYRTQQTQSSDEGVYRFPHIWPGKFYIVVSATPWYSQFNGGGMRGRVNPGVLDGGGGAPARQVDDGSAALDVAYPVTFYPGVTDVSRAEPIDLKAGQRETVDFALVAVPALHVRVNAASSEPGQFMTATLMQEIFDSTEMGQRGRNMSFNQGVTEISGITAGRYLLQLHNNGTNRGGPGLAAMREIDISGNMDLNASDVPTGVNIAGSLKFDGPAPSEPPRLMLRHRFNQGQIPLQIAADGSISSEQPIPPDTYELFLPSPSYQMTRIAASGAKLNGQSVQISSSDVKLNIVAAKSSAHVEGVALKDGKPQAGVMIVLVPQDMERPLLYRRDQSDSDGSFALNAVTPGKYTLIALETGWDLEWSKPEVIKPYLAAGATLQVVVDGTYKQDVSVQ